MPFWHTLVDVLGFLFEVLDCDPVGNILFGPIDDTLVAEPQWKPSRASRALALKEVGEGGGLVGLDGFVNLGENSNCSILSTFNFIN